MPHGPCGCIHDQPRRSMDSFKFIHIICVLEWWKLSTSNKNTYKEPSSDDSKGVSLRVSIELLTSTEASTHTHLVPWKSALGSVYPLALAYPYPLGNLSSLQDPPWQGNMSTCCTYVVSSFINRLEVKCNPNSVLLSNDSLIHLEKHLSL